MKGDSAYNKRHKFGHFSGEVLPFGCLVDYYPILIDRVNTPKSKPGEAAGSSDAHRGGDEGDALEVDPDEAELDQDTTMLQTDEDTDRPKFATRGVPGIFLGYHLNPGGEWQSGSVSFKSDDIVANLADLRRGKRVPRTPRVKRIYHCKEEGFVFPVA